jgi:hypothetical protein
MKQFNSETVDELSACNAWTVYKTSDELYNDSYLSFTVYFSMQLSWVEYSTRLTNQYINKVSNVTLHKSRCRHKVCSQSASFMVFGICWWYMTGLMRLTHAVVGAQISAILFHATIDRSKKAFLMRVHDINHATSGITTASYIYIYIYRYR